MLHFPSPSRSIWLPKNESVTSTSIFSAPQFNDEAAAYAYIEARIWTDGRVCPHCGTVSHSRPLKGKRTRIGLYKCYACRKPFSVKVGTIFQASHIAMRDWLTAMHLMCSSTNGITANQLHRTLGITPKSARFLSRRIGMAMANATLMTAAPHLAKVMRSGRDIHQRSGE